MAVRAEEQGEEYTISVPASTIKEDLYQMIEDGIQVRNHNFAQSTELVSLESLSFVVVLFFSSCHITNMLLCSRLLLSGTWSSSIENFRLC